MIRFNKNISKIITSLSQILKYVEVSKCDKVRFMDDFSEDFPFNISLDEATLELEVSFNEFYSLIKLKEGKQEFIYPMIVTEIANIYNCLLSIQKDSQGSKTFQELAPNILIKNCDKSIDNYLDDYIQCFKKWLITSTKNNGTIQQKNAYLSENISDDKNLNEVLEKKDSQYIYYYESKSVGFILSINEIVAENDNYYMVLTDLGARKAISKGRIEESKTDNSLQYVSLTRNDEVAKIKIENVLTLRKTKVYEDAMMKLNQDIQFLDNSITELSNLQECFSK